MESYQYLAMDAAGRSLSGLVQADTPRQAREQLRAQGLLPSLVNQVNSLERARSNWIRGMSPAELTLVTRQMAILLESGLTMEQTLNALIEEATEPMTKEVLNGVKNEVTAGHSLAGALSVYEKSFPDFYCALVQGGEDSGALPAVLQHLADYLDASQALKQRTALALLYPALVTTVAVMIVAGLLIYVVPQVVQVFQQSRQTLPWLTRGLIATSEFLRVAWPFLLITCVGAAVALRAALRVDATRRRLHRAMLGLPWFGQLIRGINTSRFASTLSILVGGGVPLLAALASGARVMTNVVLSEAVTHAIGRVREGASLARALGESRMFPPLLIHLIASGEMSGNLELMLARAAHLETQSLERRLTVFLTLLEPVMILVMGGVVLLIVLAILLPIMEINQLVH